MTDPTVLPEIIPEATAKRRLLIYTVLRLIGLLALAGGILRVADRIDILGVLLVGIGAASLLIRPRLLARVLGSRW